MLIMSTITISLPKSIAKQVDTETKQKGFATRSEFIRSLLRRYFTGELELEEFAKRPLSEIEDELKRTGKYSNAFIQSVMKGLTRSSLYED